MRDTLCGVRDNKFSLCSVENDRLKKLVEEKFRGKPYDPDFIFTHPYEVRFRPSGIGPSVSIAFDDGTTYDISHHEHL